MPERTISYRQAINEALHEEMERDETVIVLGEDIAGAPQSDDPAMQDAWGGVLGVTKGLIGKFGRQRVLDTPISESAIMGAAVGAAATGLRPVAELMFVGFSGVCLDQIVNQAAKLRYMFGGKARVPVVIRTTIGAGMGALAASMADVGIDDRFIKEARGKVTEGTSALFLLTSGAVGDRVTEAIKARAPRFEIISTNLSKEQEAKLREVFAE